MQMQTLRRRLSQGTNRPAARGSRWNILVLTLAPLVVAGAHAPTKADVGVPLTFNGAFHSDSVPQSTWANPCNMPEGQFSYYYEDVDWWRNPSSAPNILFPQAQCQGTGVGWPNAPQVISCGDQGYCMRFRTAADPNNSSGIWNRSQLAVADNLPLRQWHYVTLRLKFPIGIPNPGANVQLGAFFWQPAPIGRSPAVPGLRGGVFLSHTNDGSRKWHFQAQHQRENLDGTYTHTNTTVFQRDFQTEQWMLFELYFYVDPEGTSYMVYAVDHEPFQTWSGLQGTQYNPQLGGTPRNWMDMKLGVYTSPQPVQITVYMDEITVLQHVI